MLPTLVKKITPDKNEQEGNATNGTANDGAKVGAVSRTARTLTRVGGPVVGKVCRAMRGGSVG